MREADVVPLFPSLAMWWDTWGWEENKDEMIKFCYKEKRKNDPKGVCISNRGGWQSDSDYDSKDNLLITYVRDNLAKFFAENKVLKEGTGMKTSGLWMNINKKGDYNTAHNHPNCTLSGVLWLKTPDNCGKIVFTHPTDFQEHNQIDKTVNEYRSKYNYHSAYQFYPKPGRMLIFPSHLLHEVESNKSREDRVSISFNINLYSPKL